MAIVTRESSPHRYATFWQRAGAAGFDAVLSHGLTLGVHAIRPGETSLYLSILFYPMLWWIYEVGTTARWGQTLGKMFIGVQVVRTDFRRIGFGHALLRSAVAIALGCALTFYELHLVGLIPSEIVRAVPFDYLAMFASHFAPSHNLMLFAWPLAIWDIAELATMISSSARVRVASVAISHRSSRPRRGRGDERRSTMSWWRSKRFSAATTARGAKKLRTASTTLRRRAITERPRPRGLAGPAALRRAPSVSSFCGAQSTLLREDLGVLSRSFGRAHYGAP